MQSGVGELDRIVGLANEESWSQCFHLYRKTCIGLVHLGVDLVPGMRRLVPMNRFVKGDVLVAVLHVPEEKLTHLVVEGIPVVLKLAGDLHMHSLERVEHVVLEVER